MLICGKTRFGVCTATKLLNGAFTRKYRDRECTKICACMFVSPHSAYHGVIYIHVYIISWCISCRLSCITAIDRFQLSRGLHVNTIFDLMAC